FKLREVRVVSSVRDAIEQLQQGHPGPVGGTDAAAEPLHRLGERWVRGEPIDWAGHFRGSGARIVPLPSYPFTRLPYWLPGASPTAERHAPVRAPGPQLLVAPLGAPPAAATAVAAAANTAAPP